MSDRLQAIVDALAERLQRSVAVDDVDSALIASSRHYGDEDTMRIEALVQRRSPDPVVSYLRQHGLLNWTKPVHVPGRPDLGFASRYCIPLRWGDHMLGTAYLIDTVAISPEDQPTIDAAVSELIGVLRQRRAREEAQTAEHEAALRDLIGADRGAAIDAAEELLATGSVPHRGSHLVLAVLAATATSQPDAGLSTLVSSVRTASRSSEPGSTVIIAGIENGVAALVSDLDEMRALTAANRFLDRVHEEDGLHSGTSVAFTSLAEAPTAFRQAMLAAEISTALRGDARREFASLGPYIALSSNEDDLESPMVRRFGEVTNDDLTLTLERFLDEAGDVGRTSAALFVHRSTVYYRLGRIEELLGVSLEDGMVRLELHIWLKRRALRGRKR